MSLKTQRLMMKPVGRQSLPSTRNTTYIQNNFYGSSVFGYQNTRTQCCHNTDDGGMSKGAKWLLGLGAGATLLGGILKLFGVGGDDKTAEVKTDKDTKTGTDPVKTNTDEETVDEGDKTGNEPTLQSVVAEPDTLKVDKKEVKTTTTYNVQYGDTWANVITAKYKDENGNPITFSDAKELWTQLKKECGVSSDADGMPANIELPNNFKGYTLDMTGKVTPNNNFETENYKNYDGQGFQTKTSKHYTATGTINGQSIGTITGSGKEVTAQLRAQGFSDKDIKAAMENGQVQIARQNPEAE